MMNTGFGCSFRSRIEMILNGKVMFTVPAANLSLASLNSAWEKKISSHFGPWRNDHQDKSHFEPSISHQCLCFIDFPTKF